MISVVLDVPLISVPKLGLNCVLTLVFETAAVFILPALFSVDGIWFAIICAEVLSLALSVAMLKKHKERYHYA